MDDEQSPRKTSLGTIALWGALAVSTATNVAVLLATTMHKVGEATAVPEGASASAAPASAASATPPALGADASDDDRMRAQMIAAFGGISEPRADGPKTVSIIRLIANPRAFDGKKVLDVSGNFGYRMSAHGRTWLYLSATDKELQTTANAIALEFPASVDPSHFDGDSMVDGDFRAGPEWSSVAGTIVVRSMVQRVRAPNGGLTFRELYRAPDLVEWLTH